MYAATTRGSGGKRLPPAEESALTAALRGEIIQAAQRKNVPRLKNLAEDLVERQRWEGPALDSVLVLHHVSTFPSLFELAVDLVQRSHCNPLSVDGNGDTAAHYAVRANNLELLRFYHKLIGPTLFDERNNAGSTILLTAAAEANDVRAYEVLHVLEWLHLNGASLETFDTTGRTGLMWAAHRGSLVLVQWFLARGANLAHRDFMHRTALMLTCVSAVRETAQCLCAAGGIRLLHCKSLDTATPNTALGVCRTQSHFFLGLTLRLWAACWAVTRKLSLFNSQYGWYYVGLSSINLSMFLVVARELLFYSSKSHLVLCAGFLTVFCLAQFFWLMTYGTNPAYVKQRVLPSQAYRCSINAKHDLRQNGVYAYRVNSACARLQAIEKDCAWLSYEMGLVYAHHRLRPTTVPPPSSVAAQQLAPLVARLDDLQQQAAAIRNKVAAERQASCPPGYCDAALNVQQPRKACLTCRLVKPFRAHHCSECGHCVHRFDHHCVWVDNCIGEGNQRSFLSFLFFLFVSICWLWVLAGFYLANKVDRAASGESDGDTTAELYSLGVFFVIANSLVNFVWSSFVGYLLGRTTKSMITNMTFYEYLKLPTYVIRRFRGNVTGLCWDMRDLTCVRFLRNCVAFCSKSRRYDLVDYPWGAEYQPIARRAPRGGSRDTESSAAVAARQAAPPLYIGPTEPLLHYDA